MTADSKPDPTADAPDEGRLVRMFKALAHPNRLRLFEEIRQGSGSFAEREALGAGKGVAMGVGGCLLQHVIDVLNVGAPTVSHHLRELVNAGLVQTERVGKQVHCQVVPDALREAAEFFAQAAAPSPAAPSEHTPSNAARNDVSSVGVAPAGEPA